MASEAAEEPWRIVFVEDEPRAQEDDSRTD